MCELVRLPTSLRTDACLVIIHSCASQCVYSFIWWFLVIRTVLLCVCKLHPLKLMSSESLIRLPVCLLCVNIMPFIDVCVEIIILSSESLIRLPCVCIINLMSSESWFACFRVLI